MTSSSARTAFLILVLTIACGAKSAQIHRAASRVAVHSSAQPPESFSRGVQKQLSGTWFAEDVSQDKWDGDGFSQRTGNKKSCSECCIQDYKINSKMSLHPDTGVSGVILTGDYLTISTFTSVQRVDHNRVNQGWSVVCPPNQHTLLTIHGEAVVSVIGEEIIEKVVPDDIAAVGGPFTEKITPISSQMFERRDLSDPTDVRIYRKPS